LLEVTFDIFSGFRRYEYKNLVDTHFLYVEKCRPLHKWHRPLFLNTEISYQCLKSLQRNFKILSGGWDMRVFLNSQIINFLSFHFSLQIPSTVYTACRMRLLKTGLLDVAIWKKWARRCALLGWWRIAVQFACDLDLQNWLYLDILKNKETVACH